jgi:hypothetical protein
MILPTITVNSPTTNSSSSVLINVTFNGTSSSINNNTINVTISNSTIIQSYNYSDFVCLSQNDDEIIQCSKTLTLGDGSYSSKFDVVDFGFGAGNSASKASTIVVDTASPVVSLTSTPAQTSLSLAITATDTTGLNGTCTTSRGSLSGLTITESGLTCASSYSYTVSCYDFMGLLGNITQSFTTSSCDSGNSGGSTTGATTSVPQIIDLSNGYVKSMTVNDELKFNVQNQQHSVFVQSLIGDKLVLKIKSDPQIATFYPGDEKKFEITNDSYYDIYIKFNNIKNGYANLTLRTIHEAMSGVAPTVPQSNVTANSNITSESPQATSATATSSKKSWIFFGLAVVIIIVGVIVYLRKIKRDRYYY